MTGPFNAHRRRKPPRINITSLIDVMFLLLIFFMVSSTFRHHFGIDITLPEAETAAELESSTYEITVNAAGEMFFGQQPVDEEGLRQSLVALLKEEPDAMLVLRADESTDFGAAIRAVDIARAVGARQLVIPTRFFPDDADNTT